MLASLKDLIVNHLSSDEDDEKREHTLQMATAALLLEICRSDSDIQQKELLHVQQRLQDHFNLTEAETSALIDRAGSEVDNSVSLYEFTRPVNKNLSREERVHIVELLWEVAFVDGVLDKYEEFYVRKIADLLYVSQKDYIRTKHRAGLIA